VLCALWFDISLSCNVVPLTQQGQLLCSKYAGDGGAALEQLYQRWPWREIRNCPGRYVVGRERSGEALATPPADLALPAGVKVTRHCQHHGDPVLVAVLPGGGGLVTFEKDSGNMKEGIRYVHTLNTASGLARKLASLGIQLE
jgi:hypothetical protein